MPDIKSQLVFDRRTDVSLNLHNIHEPCTRSRTRLVNRGPNLLALMVHYLRAYCRRRASFLTPAVHRLSSHVFQRHNRATLVLFRLAQHVQKAKSKPSCCGLHLVRGTNVNLLLLFLNTSFKGAVFGSSHQTNLLPLHRL
jgi:hypothetical protein